MFLLAQSCAWEEDKTKKRALLLLVKEDGLLKWPRSRWNGIPLNPVHR
jgi:hypothetical protein